MRFFAWNGHRLVAYLYLELSDPEHASIIDFAASDPKAFQSLLEVARCELAAAGRRYMVVACNVRNPQQKGLVHQFCLNGFIPFYRGGMMVVHPLPHTDDDLLLDISHWYLTDLWFLLYGDRKTVRGGTRQTPE